VRERLLGRSTSNVLFFPRSKSSSSCSISRKICQIYIYTYFTPWLRASLSTNIRHRTKVRERDDLHMSFIFWGGSIFFFFFYSKILPHVEKNVLYVVCDVI